MNDDRADLHLDRTPTGRLDESVPTSHLAPLRRLHNYRVSGGDPDVRGWLVLGADGRKIGEVNDLLVDTEALRVRYLDVTLDPDLLGDAPIPEAATAGSGEPAAAAGGLPLFNPADTMGGVGGSSSISEMFARSTLSATENELTRESQRGDDTRHVLLPIGKARLDPEHDRIVAEGLRAADVLGLPDYHGQSVSRDDETGLRQRFDRGYAHSAEHDFYAHDLYDQDRFYGPRRQSGRVAGLEAGRGEPAAQDRAARNREITGELDRSVPHEDATLPVRGR
jgi:hypothetical protein